MQTPKALTVSALLAVLPGGVALSTDYKAEHALRLEIESSVKLETTTMEIEVDGERQDPHGAGMSSESHKKEVHVDRVVEAKDGKPVKVRRQFEEVEGKIGFSGGDNSNEMDLESPLGGVTIEIARNSDGKVDVTAVEGGKPDDKALQGHLPELFLDALLPEGEVEVGASWDLDADAVKRALRLDVSDSVFPRAHREDGQDGGGRGRGMRRMMGDSSLMQRAEWKGKAKLAATDEKVDGVPCAVIEIEVSASGDLPEPEMRGRERGQAFEPSGLSAPALKTTYDVDLSGKFSFAVREKRPVSLDLEGTAKVETETESTRNERNFKVHIVREGTVTFKVAVGEEAAKGK